MASARAQEAASSMLHCTYHVVLICKAEDTRNTFIHHLQTALMQSGISTFRNGELEKGENFVSELQRAIKESRISINIFSKDYTSSKWCLDDLVNILEHKKTTGHMILPVFYDVHPSDVRKQAGSYAKALLIHEEQFMGETNERKKGGYSHGTEVESIPWRSCRFGKYGLRMQFLGSLKILDLSHSLEAMKNFLRS